MSDLYPKCQLSDSKDCPPLPHQPIEQVLPTRNATLGDNLVIRRALPHRQRRMIGAWCFLDHFGPLNLNQSKGMSVGPHPHIGLQTVTWLIEGKIIHRDSLGSEQVIKPGQLNLMTAGNGIVHSEESIIDTHKMLHGAQLWLALPDRVRQIEPGFAHYEFLPVMEHDGMTITVLAGELFGKEAPTNVYSPTMALDIRTVTTATTTLPLNPHFEYGVLVLKESAIIENSIIDINNLLYLGYGRDKLSIHLPPNAHLLILGGEPFKEEVLIWWNFVARTEAEIKEATVNWQTFKHFGEIPGNLIPRMNAPDLPAAHFK